MNNFRLFLVLLILSSLLEAKTLFVSDIDDTLKIARIRDTSDTIYYGLQTDNAFLGMSQVYQLFAKKMGTNAQFLYLSNASEWLVQSSHQKFLTRHSFPKGELRLRRSGEKTDTHKINILRKKLNSGLYDQVILVGDNGEKDTRAYHQIHSEFPKIKIHTFIHQLYSVQAKDDDYLGAQIFSEQIGFATSVEVLAELEKRGLFSNKETLILQNSLIQKIMDTPLGLDEGVIAIPAWVDCRDLIWKWEDVVSFEFKDFILNRCSEDPSQSYIQVSRRRVVDR